MLSSWFTFFLSNSITSINGQRHNQVLHYITINIYYINKKPGPALVSSETDQEALEQATGRVLRLRIEGPCTEGYCWIRIQK